MMGDKEGREKGKNEGRKEKGRTGIRIDVSCLAAPKTDVCA